MKADFIKITVRMNSNILGLLLSNTEAFLK